MQININKNINWFVIILIIFFSSEVLYNYLLFSNISETRVAGAIKLITQTLMLIVILINFKENKKTILLLLTICGLYLFGQLMLPNNRSVFNNFEHLANTTFIIVLFIFFNTLNLNSKQKNYALKVFEIIILLNSIAIILGFVFNIEFFRTYKASRFGFNGLLLKASYASYFYLISLFYYTNKYWINKKGSLLAYIIILCATILTGTKASLLAVFLCFIYLFIKKKIFRNPLILMVTTIFLFILIIAIYSNYDFLISNLKTFGPIILNDGIITAVFSFRNQLLIEKTLPYINENWNTFNWFFGGMGDVNFRSGFDGFDIIYYFGIVGGLLYIYTLKISFCTFKYNLDNLFFLSALIVVTLLGGNLFYNSSVAIFLCAIRFYFELNNNYENKNI
jgi:hypothetical protein